MKLVKVLTGSALSLALLFSAAPAFATSPHSNAEDVRVTSDFKAQLYTWDITNSTGIFANSFEQDGIKWYIKGITKNSDGTWTAHYEGRRV
ncbi:antimicrobial peptide LCI [Bacillus pumilus]|uniref:antimicrobial peptide LCI n=1 Tax=Bacillus pumilus TaxID=1408 RepID=UPI0011A04973|nr:antimicrobial peptide LCI [Bacillus pumilus]